ncbi:Helix-turn-helix domain-containing protein [bacterium A37T11]|nr:Helix-turn-helix domain-containing protein [bacterium A37T11]
MAFIRYLWQVYGPTPVMDNTEIHNLAFNHAVSFVNQTNRHIFLTGKAGTGKTTFLRYIKAHSHKKMAVAAPTGVAAINAGGTTLHSLFHLPFGTYLADFPLVWNEDDQFVYNRQRLFSKAKLGHERRALLQEIDLLVIDEVSMLRADMLDAIDAILKNVRRDARPFGGLQVLFIGDMYQLPPVVKQQEWELMRQYYRSPFFFDALVMQEAKPVFLELKKVYRQKDEQFIGLLNNIRNDCCTDEQLKLLNSFYQPDFMASANESYITLTSHNALAQIINQRELALLPGKSVAFDATVKGEFVESAFPAESRLELKEGAQVMFIKNDKGDDRRFYNGKIGHVKHISKSGDELTVVFPEGGDAIVIKKEEWRNIRYNYDKVKDSIREETMGTFTQFPLRLAWAVTIHKSQGLTFDRAIIDAGASFAAGQVYVALSRLRTLGGLVLKSPITPTSIRTDHLVVAFAQNTLPDEAIPVLLEASQRNYLGSILLKTFSWDKLVDQAGSLRDSLEERNMADQPTAYRFLKNHCLALDAMREVANKFRNQLNGLLQHPDATDYVKVHERTLKATIWFGERIVKQCIDPLITHMEEWKIKKRSKKYVEELTSLLLDLKRKNEQVSQCVIITDALANGRSLQDVMEQTKKLNSIEIRLQELVDTKEVIPSKPPKGETKRISLERYLAGSTIEQIAKDRDLALSTIIGHLASFIPTGEVLATELMPPDKLDHLVKILQKHTDKPTSEVKKILGEHYNYSDIRIGQLYLQKLSAARSF